MCIPGRARRRPAFDDMCVPAEAMGRRNTAGWSALLTVMRARRRSQPAAKCKGSKVEQRIFRGGCGTRRFRVICALPPVAAWCVVRGACWCAVVLPCLPGHGVSLGGRALDLDRVLPPIDQIGEDWDPISPQIDNIATNLRWLVAK